MNKINSFKDLHTWQKAHALAINIYKITNSFPKSEQFGITNQMRRASVSVTSNIAEGFSRQGIKEKVQFYYMSLGSLTELENQLILSKDIGYLESKILEGLIKMLDDVAKLINGLIKSTKLRDF